MDVINGMKSTSSGSYRAKAAFMRAGRYAVLYLIFPALVCMYFAGGLIFADERGFIPYLSVDASVILPADKLQRPASVYPEEGISVIPIEDISTPETEDKDIYDIDMSKIPEGHSPIVPIDLSMELEEGRMPFRNSSKYDDIDHTEYLSVDHPSCSEGGFSVLVIHTHTSEAYTPDGVYSDDPEDPYLTRSKNETENVVAVGTAFCRVLEECGINVIHHKKAIDSISEYSEAYNNSADIIKYYLEKYPDIAYVFDIHRDAVALSTGEKAKTVCLLEGKMAAQVMTVVGTDTLGQDHPDWENNLALAIQLQNAVYEKEESLMREINIKQGAFNQHYSQRGLLLEFGCDGNTLAEAIYSAEYIAKELAAIIK